jgi:energy-coupling factor transporter transmembrane protein EcfT
VHGGVHILVTSHVATATEVAGAMKARTYDAYGDTHSRSTRPWRCRPWARTRCLSRSSPQVRSTQPRRR